MADEIADPASGVKRGGWSSAAQFFITNLGFAVGLGNVWRFPNVVYDNGGAVFFIPYVLCLIFLAVPILLLEGVIGQWSKKGPIGIWDMSPLFRGVGLATIYYCIIHLTYYNTPISWGAFYLFSTMQSSLPWESCGSEWKSEFCETNQTMLQFNETLNPPAEDFFYNRVLQMSDGVTEWGGFGWEIFLCNALIWLLIFGGVSLGPASLGKIAYFTTLFPYVTLFALLCYSATLPGAADGIYYYIAKFDETSLEKLGDIKVWRAAVAQVFYSTNCGFGGVIQLASYNKFRHNIFRDSILIPILDGLTSLMAGFVVFAVLGYMADYRGVGIEKVVDSGPGLIFIVYAEAFKIMEGGHVIAVFFFFMIVLLGLSSQLPNVEMICTCIADRFPWFNRNRVRNLGLRFALCFMLFSFGTFFYFGNGYYWYYLIDNRVAGIPLLITGLVELIGVGWFYSRPFVDDKLFKNLKDMGCEVKYSRWFWLITWTIVAPLPLGVILVYDLATTTSLVLLGYTFPEWSLSISWALLAISPAIMIIIALLVVCWQFEAYTLCLASCKPMDTWVSGDDEEEDAPPSYKQSVTEGDLELGPMRTVTPAIQYTGSQDSGLGSGNKLDQTVKYSLPIPTTAPYLYGASPTSNVSIRPSGLSGGDQSIGEATNTLYLGDF